MPLGPFDVDMYTRVTIQGGRSWCPDLLQSRSPRSQAHVTGGRSITRGPTGRGTRGKLGVTGVERSKRYPVLLVQSTTRTSAGTFSGGTGGVSM